MYKPVIRLVQMSVCGGYNKAGAYPPPPIPAMALAAIKVPIEGAVPHKNVPNVNKESASSWEDC